MGCVAPSFGGAVVNSPVQLPKSAKSCHDRPKCCHRGQNAVTFGTQVVTFIDDIVSLMRSLSNSSQIRQSNFENSSPRGDRPATAKKAGGDENNSNIGNYFWVLTTFAADTAMLVLKVTAER